MERIQCNNREILTNNAKKTKEIMDGLRAVLKEEEGSRPKASERAHSIAEKEGGTLIEANGHSPPTAFTSVAGQSDHEQDERRPRKRQEATKTSPPPGTISPTNHDLLTPGAQGIKTPT